MKRFANIILVAGTFLWARLADAAPTLPPMNSQLQDFTLDYQTPVDPKLQSELEAIDATLCARYGLSTSQTTVGLLDEARLRTHFGPGAQYQLRRTGFGLAHWFELTTIEKKEYWQ